MTIRPLFALGLLFALTACGTDPIIRPVDPPTPIDPTPPGPIDPTPPSTNGTVSQAAFDSIAPGMTEFEVSGIAGVPFSTKETAGFKILTYLIVNDTDHPASVWIKDGKVAHKTRF